MTDEEREGRKLFLLMAATIASGSVELVRNGVMSSSGVAKEALDVASEIWNQYMIDYTGEP